MILRHAHNRIAQDFVNCSVTPDGREGRPMRSSRFLCSRGADGPGRDALVRAGLKPGAGPVRIRLGMMGGFNYVPSPTDFINSHALIQAGRGQQPRASFQPYANNPNSSHNRLRDNGFVPSYEVARRRPAASRPQPVRSPANTAQVAPARRGGGGGQGRRAPAEFLRRLAAARLAERIARRGRPEGEARQSDQASLAVLQETRSRPAATIATVTEAREKLLDYGRPALQEIRRVATTAIADRFHNFMLSLYDSLAQAASPQ